MFVQEVEDRETIRTRWLVTFVLLSLCAHALFILTIVIINQHIPAFKPVVPAANPLVTLTLQPAPPQLAKPPAFLPTAPDPNAKHVDQPIESDNDVTLKSHSKAPRTPDSVMPDVMGKDHASDLNNSPNVPTQKQPPAPPTPPTQKQNQPKQQQPPQPKQQTPPQPNAKSTTPSQSKATPDKVVKNQVDPNGLPVLPPIDAQTMAQQDPTANQTPTAMPPPVLPAVATSVHGALGTQSDVNSPAAMASEFGKYKAKVYRTVGGHWYPDINQHFSTIPVGIVHIQFTIHSDGRVDTKVLSGDNGSLQILEAISLNSITEPAPYDVFTDSLKKEIAKEQNNDGESYTDDFTFSVYGN